MALIPRKRYTLFRSLLARHPLRSFFGLFGRSPFPRLVSHMENVGHCVAMLLPLFRSIDEKQLAKTEELAEEISRFEHVADVTKVEIRNHLPRETYLPVDRGQLLEILTIQDRIADTAEDIARMMTLRPMEIPLFLRDQFFEFLQKNVDSFETAQQIIQDWQNLLESSFGKVEVRRITILADKVALQEHEIDLLQHELLKILFREENLLPYPLFYLWQKVIQKVSDLSNLSENLANRVQTILEWR